MEKPVVFDGYRVCTDYDGAPFHAERSALGVVTYKAEDTATQEPVSLKIIPVAILDQARFERLERHIEQARLLQHLNIAQVLNFGRAGDAYFYVQEYVEGDTAAAWVKECGPLPADVALRIGLQVAQALSLAAFHVNPHCAIGPRNLVLTSDQTATGEWPFIKLINFGLAELEFAEAAKQRGARLENDASTFYRSPEQALRRYLDIRSDIYSLGCTLWFLLVGAPPFFGEGKSVLAAAVMTEPPVEQLKHVPKAMRSLLAHLLRRNPEERPSDPVALIQLMERCLARVERSQRSARRAGIPSLAAALPTKAKVEEAKVEEPEEDRAAHTARRLVRMAAAGALAILLGALVALGTSELARKSIFKAISGDKSLGVPIGVANPTVAPPVKNNRTAEKTLVKPSDVKQRIAEATQTPRAVAEPSQTAPVITKAVQTPATTMRTPETHPVAVKQVQTPPIAAKAAQTPAAIAATKAERPPVQTSTGAAGPNAKPLSTPSPPPSAPISSRSAPDVPLAGLASSESPSRADASGANAAAEVAPPAEGPDEIAAAKVASAEEPEPTPPIDIGDDDDSSNRIAAQAKKETKPAAASAKRASRSRSVAKKTRSRPTVKLHEVRRALPSDSETVPSGEPSRVIRAQFLGKTPDGDSIFDVEGPAGKIVVPPPRETSQSVREVRAALPPDQ